MRARSRRSPPTRARAPCTRGRARARRRSAARARGSARHAGPQAPHVARSVTVVAAASPRAATATRPPCARRRRGRAGPRARPRRGGPERNARESPLPRARDPRPKHENPAVAPYADAIGSRLTGEADQAQRPRRASIETEDLLEGPRAGVRHPLLEQLGHRVLPAGVDLLLFHVRRGRLEVVGLEIAEHLVAVAEDRVVPDAGGAEGGEQLRPA